MFDAAVIVPRPVRQRGIRDIGMRGSDDEIPDPLVNWKALENHNQKPDGWWLSGGCFFEGAAGSLNDYGEITAAEQTSSATSCTGAFCIADGRLLVIVSPNDFDEPAIWIAASCADVAVETRGTQGLRGRPKELTLRGNGWSLELISITRVYRRLNDADSRLQTGQEASLVKALAAAAAVSPREPTTAAPVDAPAIGSGYLWQQEDELGGVYRLIRQGQPTTATSLVDRELSPEDQIRALEALNWLPEHVLNPIIKVTRENRLGKLWIPELPSGRLSSPFPFTHAQLHVEGGEVNHPVRRYFWPEIDANGGLILDPDEKIEREWTPPSSEIASLTAEGGGSIDNPLDKELRAYLTNQRLVSIARSDSSGTDSNKWAFSHFRWEWVHEIGSIHTTLFRRTMVMAKRILLSETKGFYVRFRLANGKMIEIRFPGPPGEAGSITELISQTSELIASAPGREIQAETQGVQEGLNSIIARKATAITGAVPYSLPERL